MPLTKKQNERKRVSLNNIEGIKDMILKSQVEVIRSNPVCASVKGPKADGIACPEIDRYNDHIIVKEKDVSLKHDPALTGS